MDFPPVLIAGIVVVVLIVIVVARKRRPKTTPAPSMLALPPEPVLPRQEMAASRSTTAPRELTFQAKYEKRLQQLLAEHGWKGAHCQLPAPPPFYAGHRSDLARAFAILDGARPPRMLAITAARELAGVGRTGFATVLSHLLAERFPDAQLFVDLRGDDPHAEPLGVVDAMRHVIRSLNPKTAFPRDLAELPALYRKTLEGRRVLLLVENLRPQPHIELLLPPAGSLALLTSRESAAFARIETIVIEPFSRPEARAFLRASGARVTREPDKHLDLLAELSGYLPAALRLNAGRLSSNPPQPVDSLFDHLKKADAFQQPLDAALSVSFAALPEESQRVWLRLAGDAGDLDTGEGSNGALIRDLNAAGLLHIAQREPLRFGVHESARAFAGQMSAPVDRARENGTATPQHAPRQPVKSSSDVKPQKFDESWKSAREFVQQFQSQSPSDFLLTDLPAPFAEPSREPAPAYAEALRFLADYPKSGAHHEIAEIEAAVSAARALGDRPAAVRAFALLGKARVKNGAPRHAVPCFEQWVEFARETADRRAEADALGSLGIGWTDSGFADRGKGCFEAQLCIAREIGDRPSEMHALGKLGQVKAVLGDHAAAAALYNDQLKIARELDDRVAEVDALEALGIAATRGKDFDTAAQFHEEQLNAARVIGDHAGETRALGHLGHVALLRGKIEDAIANYDAQLEIAGWLGDAAARSHAHASLGVAWARQGDLRKAVGHYEQQLRVAQEMQNRLGEATAYSNIGSGLERLADPAGAIAAWEKALAIYETLGSPSADSMRRWIDRARKALAT